MKKYEKKYSSRKTKLKNLQKELQKNQNPFASKFILQGSMYIYFFIITYVYYKCHLIKLYLLRLVP